MAGLNPSAVIFICILFFIAFQPAPPISYGEEERIENAVTSELHSLQLLQNSTFGDFAPWDTNGPRWLNLTGLREGDGCNWGVLPAVQARAQEQLQDATLGRGLEILEGNINGSVVLYQNISGWLRGRWVRSVAEQGVGMPEFNLSNIVPDAPYLSKTFGRNITGAEGKVQMRLKELEDAHRNTQDSPIHWLSARITIQDETSYADGWTTLLYGVHHLESGSIVLTTTSEKFAGIFALPHFSLTSHLFNLSKPFLNSSLANTISEQKKDPVSYSFNPWTSVVAEEESSFNPLCDMVVYLQQHALNVGSTGKNNLPPIASLLQLESVEEELRFPTGMSPSDSPDIGMSMVVYSPDCGFILESKAQPTTSSQRLGHLQGPKIEVYLISAKHVILALAIVVIAQLFLLVQQMKATTTPSTRSRISFYTLAMMSLGTGFAAFSFLFMSSFLASMYLTSMIVAFLLFLEGNFFGVKFLMDVWTAQEPERTERQRRGQEQLAAQNARILEDLNRHLAARPSSDQTPQQSITQPTPASMSPTLPLPVTAPQPLLPLAINLGTPLSQAVPPQAGPPTTTPLTLPPLRPATFGTIYTRYCLLLLFLIFLSIHAATSWPLGARSFFANSLVATYLSFWIPQIHRNILRNCRKPFAFRFILGQSILRLIPIAYLWCYPDNILFAEPDRRIFIAYVVWMTIQILVLTCQEFLGPRWCVSERWSWVPTAWEYHPILREDEEGATMPIGYSASSPLDEEPSPSGPTSPDLARRRRTSVVGIEGPLPTSPSTSTHDDRRHGGTRTFDCAICMQAIEAPVVPSGGATSTTDDSRPHHHPTRRLSTDTTPPGTNAESTGLLSGLARSAIFGRASVTAAATASGLVTAGLGGRLLLERQRREYMVTPCRHIFHTPCLEGWMGYRLQCPICRETLPPL